MPVSSKNVLRLLLFCGMVAGAFVVATHWRSGASVEAAPSLRPPLAVRSVVVETQPGYSVREAYNGRVVSRRESRLGFPLGGRLDEVLVREGDRVEAGQRLAKLDTAKLRATRRELASQVAELEARVELARLSAQRNAKLANEDSISRQRYDETRIEEIALRARLEAARAGIERVDIDLGHSELLAPYGGSITRRFVDEGTILAPGEQVIQLIESAVMEARVGVPPAAATQLEIAHEYELDHGAQTLRATLTAVLADIETATRTVTAVLRIENPPPSLRHGALVRLALPTRHDAAGFWLPITGLAESRRGLWSAYALVPDPARPGLHRVDRRELQLIHTESDRAYLRGTLRDGERVVAAGLHRLVPNQRVRLASEGVDSIEEGRE